MKQTKVTVNLKALDGFKMAMTKGMRARVGVLGSGAARTDGGPMDNATIGIIQMFGSVTNNIPPRDFLIMPIKLNGKEITKEMQKSRMVKEAIDAGDYKKIFMLLGVVASTYVQRAFETGGFGLWAPNRPRTIAAKGSSKPLIDTAQLRRAITNDVKAP